MASTSQPEDGGFLDDLAGGGKAVLGAVGEALAVPQRTVVGGIKDTIDFIEDPSLKSGLQALNPIDDWGDKNNTPSKALGLDGLGGLAADIVLDPLNFLGVGLVAKASKAPKALDMGADFLKGTGDDIASREITQAMQQRTKIKREIGKIREERAAAKKTYKADPSEANKRILETVQTKLGTEKSKLKKAQEKMVEGTDKRSSLRNLDEDNVELIEQADELAKYELAQGKKDMLQPVLNVGVPFSRKLQKEFKIGQGIKLGKKGQAVAKAAAASPVLSGLNKAFNPAAGIDRRVYEAARLYDGATQAMTLKMQGKLDEATARVEALPRNIRDQEMDRITEIARKVQGMEGDITTPAGRRIMRKHDMDGALELEKLWGGLDESSKEFLKTHREFYDHAHELQKAFGMNSKQIKQYFSHVAADTPGISKGAQSAAMQNVAMISEPGFAKRRLDKIPEMTFKELSQSATLHNAAVHKAMRERLTADSVGRAFGVKGLSKEEALEQGLERPDKSAQKILDAKRGEVYLPKDINDSLKTIAERAAPPTRNRDEAVAGFKRGFRWLSGKEKALMFSSNPGQFATSSLGDLIAATQEGIPTLNPMAWIKHNRTAKKIDDYVNYGKGGDEVVNLGGQDFTIKELARSSQVLNQRAAGALQNASGQLEQGRMLAPRLKKTAEKNQAQKIQARKKAAFHPFHTWSNTMQRGGNWRDARFRTVTMLTGLEGEAIKAARRGENLGKAGLISRAGKKTKNSLFDYQELTPFEEELRNFIPFYTWTRKNLPRQARMVFEKPGSIATPLKISDYMYEQDNGLGRGMIPDYIRDGMIPLPSSLVSRIAGPGNFAFFNWMLPQADLGRFQSQRVMGEDPGIPGFDEGEFLGQFNPVLRVPIELGFNRSAQTGLEIEDPLLHTAKGMLGQPGSAFFRAMDADRSGWNRALPLFGYATGLRITHSNESDMKATALARLQGIRQAKLDELREKYQ